MTTRQYARLVQEWVASIGLDPAKFGTHSLRRTKVVLIYSGTGNDATDLVADAQCGWSNLAFVDLSADVESR